MTRALRASLIAVAFVALVGCSEIGINLDTPPPPSGIRGLVLLGPTCPGPVAASPGDSGAVPCVTPYAAELVVLDNENVKVASVTSGSDGRFSVDVPPGEYIVAPETGTDSYPIANPVSVTVVAGQYAEIEINYDTGIR